MAIGALPPVMADGALNPGTPGQTRAQNAANAAPHLSAAALPAAAIIPSFTALDRLIAYATGEQDSLTRVFALAEALLKSLPGDVAARPPTSIPTAATDDTPPVSGQALSSAVAASDDAAETPSLPPALAAALQSLLSLRFSGSADAAALKTLLKLSGLFHEAGQAAPDDAGPPLADLKAALLDIRSQLRAFLTPALIEAGLARVTRAPAPKRRGALEGQPPLALAAGSSLTEKAAQLAEAADQGLARILLYQAANLDRPADPLAARSDPQRLVFELPIATPTGTSVAACRIEEEERRPSPDRPALKSWKMEIALKLSHLGGLTARVGLLPGDRVVVGLWCEQPETLESLSEELPLIRAGLLAAGLDVGAIDLHPGRPPERPADPAHPPPSRLDLSL